MIEIELFTVDLEIISSMDVVDSILGRFYAFARHQKKIRRWELNINFPLLGFLNPHRENPVPNLLKIAAMWTKKKLVIMSKTMAGTT